MITRLLTIWGMLIDHKLFADEQEQFKQIMFEKFDYRDKNQKRNLSDYRTLNKFYNMGIIISHYVTFGKIGKLHQRDWMVKSYNDVKPIKEKRQNVVKHLNEMGKGTRF